MKQHVLLAAASVFAIAATGTAWAQEQPAPEAEQDAPDEARRLEQVTVTAVKREQGLNDVPVSVTAFTDDMRQELALDNLSDFARFTPSLAFSAGDDRVFVRGVGRQTNTNGSDPGIATYADGIYDVSTSAVSRSDFFVDRVEVLRGPQGTLYGRNSIGGAINVISKRPTDELTAQARLTVGSFETTSVEAAVSGALSDRFRVKLGGAFDKQNEGYLDNAAGGPSEGGANENTYVELQLEADLTDNLSLWVKADTTDTTVRNRATIYAGDYDVSPFPTGYLTPGNAFGYTQPGFTQAGSTTFNPGATDIRTFNTDTPTESTLDDAFGLATIATWSLPTIDVKYSGGYRTYVFDSFRDDDETDVLSYTFPLDPANIAAGEVFTGGPNCQWLIENVGPVCAAAVINPSRTFGYIEDKTFFSHEITAQSTGDSDLWWIAGAYYYQEDFKQESHFGNSAQAAMQAPFGAAPNPSGDFVDARSDLTTKSFALFGQADYSLTDTVTLTGGLRYSADDKEGTEEIRVLGYGIVPGFTLGGSGNLAPVLDLTGSVVSLVDAPGVASAVTIDPVTGRAVRSLASDWNAVSGTAGVQWQPDADTNYYLRYSRGYKSGGFNAGGISQFPETDEELLDSVEIGAKKSIGDGLQINASAYYYKYDGLQVPLDAVESGVTLTRFFNIEDSRAKGIELEAVWRPVDDLRLMFSYAFNDSEVRSACCFIDLADPLALQPGAQPNGPLDASGNQPQNLKGEKLPRTVPHKLGMNASYDIDLGNRGDVVLSGNYSWQDATYHGIFNRSYTEAPSFDQFDLIALWNSPNEAYRVTGYVKNVFDEQGYDGARGTVVVAPAGIGQTLFLTPPRTYGVQLQLTF